MTTSPVLVIEDHEATLSLLCTLLSRRIGCLCATASDVAVAKEAIDETEFVAIVIDGTVRDRQGELLLEWLRRERPHMMSRVIAITAEAPGTRFYQRIAATAPCTLLGKPFEIDAVVAAVLECMKPSGGSEGDEVTLSA